MLRSGCFSMDLRDSGCFGKEATETWLDSGEGDVMNQQMEKASWRRSQLLVGESQVGLGLGSWNWPTKLLKLSKNHQMVHLDLPGHLDLQGF